MQLQNIVTFILGWPFIIYVMGIGLLSTIMLRGIQFRKLWQAITITLFPVESKQQGEISPLQAFLSTLNSNVGNGGVAGMAVAVATGGPGAGFWMVIASFLLMSVRFAEVYLSTWYGAKEGAKKTGLGGPMLYLEHVPGGSVLPHIYAILTLFFGCMVGNGMQANSISLGIQKTLHVPVFAVGLVLTVIVLYILLGGARRIVMISDALAPIKVILFFITVFAVLFYNAGALVPALQMIIVGAFSPQALAAGFMGFTLQQAIRVGISNGIVATESGLGSAAIFFGYTGSKDPEKNGLLGMMSAFIATIICFIVVLTVVATGAWTSGQTSTPLVILAYSSLFGSLSGWIVSFLSITFGLGVLVAYAYLTRACWLFLTKGSFAQGHIILYAGSTLLGAMINAEKMWTIIDVVNAAILLVNLYGVAYLLPQIANKVKHDQNKS